MFVSPMIGLCLVLTVAVVLLRQQRGGGLPRNGTIGVRTRRTLRSDAAWSAGQAAATPYLVAMAAVSAFGAVGLGVVQLAGGAEALGHVLALGSYGLVVVTALLAWRAADRAADAAAD
ncbi:SdpI family protein [Puerhibacterium sp. TATVAM-FAB25]|uniref:SdpI family protein n=1 Tax=Puerhibacterium sp. TATVAM-FAB25 TaxID=3093699 RepID=UPI00397A1611